MPQPPSDQRQHGGPVRPQVTRFTTDLRGLGVRLGEALVQEMRDPLKAPVRELWPMQLTLGDSDSIRL